MAFLVDTNILLRNVEPTHPMHAEAVDAMAVLLASQRNGLHTLPQNIAEFWNVSTRPRDKNGLGWTPSQTDTEVRKLESLLTVIPDTAAIYAEWRRLVLAHSVRGAQVHDARIAAAMNSHGITHLVTFNRNDFIRYPGITVMNPGDVISAYAGP